MNRVDEHQGNLLGGVHCKRTLLGSRPDLRQDKYSTCRPMLTDKLFKRAFLAKSSVSRSMKWTFTEFDSSFMPTSAACGRAGQHTTGHNTPAGFCSLAHCPDFITKRV